jgi:hypothetical protein
MSCVTGAVAIVSLTAVAAAFGLGMLAQARNDADEYRWRNRD